MREFEIDIEDNIVVKGDRKYLIQLLDNLIINAITYCKTGKITIELEKFEGFMYLNILDEGIGIPFEELKDIFEEFMVSSKTRTPAGNRGVGLALCKRVLKFTTVKLKRKVMERRARFLKLPFPFLESFQSLIKKACNSYKPYF
jgi:signal transduction histidine kinase